MACASQRLTAINREAIAPGGAVAGWFALLPVQALFELLQALTVEDGDLATILGDDLLVD